MLANHTDGVSLYLLFSLRKMAICGIINIKIHLDSPGKFKQFVRHLSCPYNYTRGSC